MHIEIVSNLSQSQQSFFGNTLSKDHRLTSDDVALNDAASLGDQSTD